MICARDQVWLRLTETDGWPGKGSLITIVYAAILKERYDLLCPLENL